MGGQLGGEKGDGGGRSGRAWQASFIEPELWRVRRRSPGTSVMLIRSLPNVGPAAVGSMQRTLSFLPLRRLDGSAPALLPRARVERRVLTMLSTMRTR